MYKFFFFFGPLQDFFIQVGLLDYRPTDLTTLPFNDTMIYIMGFAEQFC